MACRNSEYVQFQKNAQLMSASLHQPRMAINLVEAVTIIVLLLTMVKLLVKWDIPEALRRARVSRARPSSTKASSMTGSSRKPISKPAPGSRMLAVPAVKDVAAPRPIKLFMLGLPLHSKKVAWRLDQAEIHDTQRQVRSTTGRRKQT